MEGANIGNTKPLPSPIDRHPSLVYECHPQLGDYIYSPLINMWTQQRSTIDGRVILLAGRARSPTNEQLALWSEIDERLEVLTATAVNSAVALLVGQHEDLFRPNELVLHEIRMEADGSFVFFFGFPREDEVWMWPMVVFSDWVAGPAQWTV